MSLSLLTAQYFQQLDPHLLTFPEDNYLLHPTTQETIYNTLFSESHAANDHPLPPPAYRTRVLKRLITKLESLLSNPEEDEINESLLEEYSTLLTLPKPSSIEQAQQLTYITYTAPLEDDPHHSSPQSKQRRTILTSESRSAIITAGTTGHRTWEAALHLATYLSTAAGRAHITGKKVLELGAGTGLVSMFCARYLEPEVVVATDRELGLMRQIGDCARRNGLAGDGDGVFKGWIWEWGRELSRGVGEDDDDTQMKEDGEVDGEKVEFDVALGADLIYDIDLVPLLVQTVKSLFEKYAVKEFLISATLRNERTFGAFLNACEESALKVERVPFESPAEEVQMGFFHSTVIPIRTYRITA